MKKITSLLMVIALLASCTSKAQKEETTLKEEAKEVKIELNTKEVKVEDLIDTTNKDYTYQIKETVDTSKEGKQIVTVVKINNKTKEQEEIKREIVIVKSAATNTTVTTTPATNVSTSYEKRSETTTTPTTTKAVVKETTVAKEENKVKIPKTSNLDTSNPYVIEAMNMVGESGNCGYITGQLEKRVIGDGKYVEYGDIQEWDESLAEIGDIVTYEPNGNSGHVAIYLGNGQALHGGVSGDKGAVISSINLSQYSKKYLRKKLNVVTVHEELTEEQYKKDMNEWASELSNKYGFTPDDCKSIDWNAEISDEEFNRLYESGIIDYCGALKDAGY